MAEELNNRVRWPIFTWVIAIFVIAFGWVISSQSIFKSEVRDEVSGIEATADLNKDNIAEMKGDIKVILERTEWLEKYFEEYNKVNQTFNLREFIGSLTDSSLK